MGEETNHPVASCELELGDRLGFSGDESRVSRWLLDYWQRQETRNIDPPNRVRLSILDKRGEIAQ